MVNIKYNIKIKMSILNFFLCCVPFSVVKIVEKFQSFEMNYVFVVCAELLWIYRMIFEEKGIKKNLVCIYVLQKQPICCLS